jgi:inward rectifier potassium channel
MVFVKGFDEVFSNNVVSKTSYISSEIKWGAKFNIMYEPSEDKSITILDLKKLNDYKEVELPDPVQVISMPG